MTIQDSKPTTEIRQIYIVDAWVERGIRTAMAHIEDHNDHLVARVWITKDKCKSFINYSNDYYSRLTTFYFTFNEAQRVIDQIYHKELQRYNRIIKKHQESIAELQNVIERVIPNEIQRMKDAMKQPVTQIKQKEMYHATSTRSNTESSGDG